MENIRAAEGETVPRMFQSRVQISANQVALRYKKLGIWHDVTWEEYRQNVRAVCLGLVALGLKPGECVSVIGENSPEWVYTDLGNHARRRNHRRGLRHEQLGAVPVCGGPLRIPLLFRRKRRAAG